MDFHKAWKDKIQSRDLRGAVALCQEAIDKNPEEVGPYFLRGLTKYYLENHQGAINDYSITIERGLNAPGVYLARA